MEIQAALPFPLLGIDSDNGSEFINDHLLSWCTAQQITFTRSRPANKNDGCHVEQKNWDIARRTVGYWRYDTPGEVAVLNQIWPALSPLINLFTPQQKLVTKTRTGAKVTKTLRHRPNPLPAAAPPPAALDDGRRPPHLPALLATTNPAAARREVGPPVRHPARAGPPQERHPPSPNQPPSTDPEPRSTSRSTNRATSDESTTPTKRAT